MGPAPGAGRPRVYSLLLPAPYRGNGPFRYRLDLLEAGTHQVDSRASRARGLSALNLHDAPSPFSAGAVVQPPFHTFPAFPANTFTNFQFSQVNAVRGKTLAGTYTVTPSPSVTLYFAEGLRIVRLQAVTPAYYPNQIVYEGAASRCDSDRYPVAFDDHVSEIEMPIFYIARADNWFYPETLTSSGDITKLTVNPVLDPSLYGHADFFLANDAADVIWQPILDRIRAHRQGLGTPRLSGLRHAQTNFAVLLIWSGSGRRAAQAAWRQ